MTTMTEVSGPDRLAEEALAAARLWAVTAQPYLSTLLFALTPIPTEGLRTFGVDRRWRLYFDPECLSRWTTEEAGAVLVHEAGHLLRDHAGRADALGVDFERRHRFNVAADLEINDDLADLPLPSGGLVPALFELPPGQLAETYYAGLRVVGPRPDGWWCEGGSGVGGQREGWEVADDSLGAGVRPGEDQLIRQVVAMEIRRMMNAGGHLPEHMARWAEAFLRPHVDWRRQLGAAVRGGLGSTAGGVDYRYGRPSRRNGSPIGRDVVLPRLVQPTPRVAVVVDTSASMDVDLLSAAMGELRGILSSAGVSGQSTVVISCDTAVRASQEVFSAAQVRLAGGGGTELGTGLEAVAGLVPRCDVAVVLTDGYTEWPETRISRTKTIIGVIGGRRGHEPEWAQVIDIPCEAGAL